MSLISAFLEAISSGNLLSASMKVLASSSFARPIILILSDTLLSA